MFVSNFGTRHVPVIPEDNNVVTYESPGMFKIDLIRRARCVMGLHGVSNWETTPLNGNSIQHAERMIVGMHKGEFSIMEHIVAEYARHVASETVYWL